MAQHLEDGDRKFAHSHGFGDDHEESNHMRMEDDADGSDDAWDAPLQRLRVYPFVDANNLLWVRMWTSGA